MDVGKRTSLISFRISGIPKIDANFTWIGSVLGSE